MLFLEFLSVELLHIGEEDCPKERSHSNERHAIALLDK